MAKSPTTATMTARSRTRPFAARCQRPVHGLLLAAAYLLFALSCVSLQAAANPLPHAGVGESALDAADITAHVSTRDPEHAVAARQTYVTCSSAMTNCTHCSTNSTTCALCDKNATTTFFLNPATRKCVLTCPAGYWGNSPAPATCQGKAV